MLPGIDLSKEDLELLNSEQKFFSVFGIAADHDLRKAILKLKSEVSIANYELNVLHKAGLLRIKPKGVCRVWIEMSLFKLFLSAFEIALFMILYSWPIFLYSGKSDISSSIPHLAIAMVMAVVGFLLVYYQFQRNIRPYIILKKHNFRFGESYEPQI